MGSFEELKAGGMTAFGDVEAFAEVLLLGKLGN